MKAKIRDTKPVVLISVEMLPCRHVYLTGYSEGSTILHKVYLSLKKKHKVKKIIILAGGGLSQYEKFKIQSKSRLPVPYKSSLVELDETKKLIEENPTATDKFLLGWPYCRWAGFGKYRPVNDLAQIDIPILCLHGSKDLMAPVESSRFIKTEFERLRKNNLTYIEYPDFNHAFNNNFNLIFNEIHKWIKL